MDACGCSDEYKPTDCETVERDPCVKSDDAAFASGGSLESYSTWVENGTCFPIPSWGDVGFIDRTFNTVLHKSQYLLGFVLLLWKFW